MSNSRRIHINKIRLTSSQSHVVAFEGIAGKVAITGKVDCIGCSGPNNKGTITSSTKSDSLPTLLSLFANSVSNFVIEDADVLAPLRLTARNVGKLQIMSSSFNTVPWPGFYVYNASRYGYYITCCSSARQRHRSYCFGYAKTPCLQAEGKLSNEQMTRP
jgi:hypothetical protein